MSVPETIAVTAAEEYSIVPWIMAALLIAIVAGLLLVYLRVEGRGVRSEAEEYTITEII